MLMVVDEADCCLLLGVWGEPALLLIIINPKISMITCSFNLTLRVADVNGLKNGLVLYYFVSFCLIDFRNSVLSLKKKKNGILFFLLDSSICE